MEKSGLNEIREKFLAFFEEKEHIRMESASLVPQNDNSLLLINSGMAPLKPYFTGQQIPPKNRVTTCQKCIRTGDIENVGKTARHGTFFEMLGNFSFGDYFKEDAIKWAWEFFTEVMKLPEERLYVSVYQDDDEAYDMWNKKMGLSPERIFRMGKEDNFWEHGLGPCGPCSEIYYDKGEKYGCGSENCTVGCECDRFMEIWNLVFTQFNKEEDGSYSNLANPNIDTGMGLERLATVLQDVDSIFDIDTIKAVRDEVCRIAGTEYNKSEKEDVSIRVITDHIRSVTFMTADGVLPSNEGRGYVLRRLLRRAARHGKLLGIQKQFLSELSKIVIENSKNAYPQLEEKKDYINKILSIEEERFYETLDQGMEILKSHIERIKSQNSDKILNGKDTFKMYDTYGFPLDLMKEILEEEEISVNEEEFLKEMDKQKTRARNARSESTYMGSEETVFHKLNPSLSTDFVGYDNYTKNDCRIIAIVSENNIVESAKEGENVSLILDKTPFYAEMGGQAGDSGLIESDKVTIEIQDCAKFGGNKFIHTGVIRKGEVKLNDIVTASIDEEKRLSTARNHTSTHILQKALREVLGTHVEQAGSFVSSSRLRFDFTHFEPISKDDLSKIERIVNKHILKCHEVTVSEMSMEEAKKMGATALFGEKYTDVVRVCNIGGYSIELCGGTHLTNSSQAGTFKIVSETGLASGVRRIEALTGENALDFFDEHENILNSIKDTLNVSPANIQNKINSMIEENKKLNKELESLKSKMASSIVDDIINSKEIVNGTDVICYNVDGYEMNDLRTLGDKIKSKLENYVILLASAKNDKVSFVSMVAEITVKSGANAGNIVKEAATICGGGGGGRPNMAQAGGKDASKINEALSSVKETVKSIIS